LGVLTVHNPLGIYPLAKPPIWVKYATSRSVILGGVLGVGEVFK